MQLGGVVIVLAAGINRTLFSITHHALESGNVRPSLREAGQSGPLPLYRYTYEDVELWLARQLELSRG